MSKHVWQVAPKSEHVQAFVDVFTHSTTADIAEGIAWYGEARAYAHKLALDSGLPIDTCAAVLAITSQRNTWARNMLLAHRMCMYGDYSGTLGSIASKCKRLIQGREAPSSVVSGPKISAFYSAIMGDNTSLTIDAHMAAMCGLNRTKEGKQSAPTGNKYTYIVSCLKQAAGICGYGDDVAAFQAITWVTRRRILGYQRWADSVGKLGS